jgi:hypothetical protein
LNDSISTQQRNITTIEGNIWSTAHFTPIYKYNGRIYKLINADIDRMDVRLGIINNPQERELVKSIAFRIEWKANETIMQQMIETLHHLSPDDPIKELLLIAAKVSSAIGSNTIENLLIDNGPNMNIFWAWVKLKRIRFEYEDILSQELYVLDLISEKQEKDKFT